MGPLTFVRAHGSTERFTDSHLRGSTILWGPKFCRWGRVAESDSVTPVAPGARSRSLALSLSPVCMSICPLGYVPLALARVGRGRVRPTFMAWESDLIEYEEDFSPFTTGGILLRN